MNRPFYVSIMSVAFFTVMLIQPYKAYAALGGSADSVEADRTHFKAAKTSSVKKTGYSIEEIDTGTIKIREYVSSDDHVFGIAWKGLRHPDLGVLLGQYADEYTVERAQKAQVRGQKRSSSVTTDNVTVEQWGHMRKLQGRAYIQSQLPEGMQPNDIK
jgi:hypothetical protein